MGINNPKIFPRKEPGDFRITSHYETQAGAIGSGLKGQLEHWSKEEEGIEGSQTFANGEDTQACKGHNRQLNLARRSR